MTDEIPKRKEKGKLVKSWLAAEIWVRNSNGRSEDVTYSSVLAVVGRIEKYLGEYMENNIEEDKYPDIRYSTDIHREGNHGRPPSRRDSTLRPRL
ncbi:hypothetical protein GEV33_001827 [Tenebrio molitor]|uniref:Uncharacterized protein n=1 Tax=Tenebrio molitor TaxID=7067 RepID=A0A8J6HU98_TENMO|nr:hypothetical protein GEV33_001827 [Tenebrio molitor]